MPEGFEIKEMQDPLFPLDSNVNSKLNAFNLSEFQFDDQDEKGVIHDATGSSPVTSRVFFAQSDPFSGLSLIQLNTDDTLAWDKVKRQMLQEL